ncbi:MAG: flagellar basal body rod modification protein FlgD [Herbaspirillum sp.]|jgi:flagellar basal-body rod modification protein FlgD|nr:flagellar basal body rod modification protein FlgD [Herbaspirillum sp.]
MTVSSDLLSAMNGTTPTTTSTTGGSLTTNSAAATQQEFLTLLSTQLQNQDPTNPMDNSQLTSQIAQLSTVSGIQQLNSSLTTLMSNLQSGQATQAISMIGHNVLAPGSNIQLSTSTSTAADGTTSTTHTGVFGAQLATAADDVKVSIQDANGKTVDSIDLGKQAAGTVPIVWDGTTSSGTVAADGQYTFTVTATAAGSPVTTTNLAFGNVASVNNDPTKGTTLNVTNIGSIAPSTVVEIL